eukprot:28845_1
MTLSMNNAWISFDFGKNIKINPTKYTLRHSSCINFYLRGWDFMGSNDGKEWAVIKKHVSDTSLNKPRQSHTWTIQNCNTFYQMFKIQMTTKDSAGYWCINANGFEIYGHLQMKHC